jgi:hypothetical protein
MGRIRALMPAAPMSRLMSRVVPMASAGSSERLQSGGRCREFKSALAIAGHKLTRACVGEQRKRSISLVNVV